MAVKAYALTTRQRVIDFGELGSLTSTQGLVLDRIIDAVTEYVENYTGRRFKRGTYTSEVYDSDGSGVIALLNTPVSAVTSVERRDSGLNDSSWDTIDGEYYQFDSSGLLRGVSGYKFPTGRGSVRVTYTGGYDFDNTSTFLSDTEAGDIEYVVWKLVIYAWKQRKGGGSVQSESLGDYSVSFRKATFEDDEVKAILDKYTPLVLGGGLTPRLY